MNSAMQLTERAESEVVRWRVTGWRESVYTSADGHVMAGSSCEKCGQSIRYVVTLKSTVGDVLNVGQDCAVTLKGGPELAEIRNAERAYAHEQWLASPECARLLADGRDREAAKRARASTAEVDHALELHGLRAIVASTNTSRFEKNMADGRMATILGGNIVESMDDVLIAGLSLAWAKSQMPASRHLGNVGEKFTDRKALFEAMIPIDTAYGPSYVNKFRCTDGAVLVWFSRSGDLRRSDVGQMVTIRGSVKTHGEYQGEAQTTVTRCKIAL